MHVIHTKKANRSSNILCYNVVCFFPPVNVRQCLKSLEFLHAFSPRRKLVLQVHTAAETNAIRIISVFAKQSLLFTVIQLSMCKQNPKTKYVDSLDRTEHKNKS